ncbi:MATE family efflux transporter [uncultured Roseovarius sp.]|uniref:MATE family efflux transporter n=1 Tax=uncultured Roseovarius sp. TaxID=293344 RepID=UPI0026314797|nr:MATE family efflux transporter [uncultured Roseovarius sp.]
MALTDSGGSFTQGNLFRHVSVMSFTSSIGLMAIFAVDLIDIVFISMLGREELAAAAGYASTIMFFASAVNIGLSIAAGALVARAEGKRDRVAAREYATSSAVIAIAVGLLLPVLALPFLGEILALIGAKGSMADMAADYLWIILPTTFVSGLSMVAVAVLRSYGDARGAMYPALLGGGVNAVADPIFIFALGMGLNGAAVATVLARLATMVLALGLAVGKYNAFARPRPHCVARDFRDTAEIAMPAVMGTVATPVGTAIVMREMAKYGADAVAALAVINRLVPVVFAVVLALSGAIGPIFGQNFGAGRMDRVYEALLDGLKFLAVYVLAMSALLFLLRAPIADAFDATEQMRGLLYLYLGPLALASFFNGTIFVANASFDNLGHPGYSTGVNWARNTLGTWPFAIAFGALWGAQGVLVGQAVGGALFAAIAAWLSLRVIESPCRDPLQAHFTCPDQRMQVMANRSYR